MKDGLLKLSVKMQTLLMQEEGQDLIEYALVVALIAFAAVATMKTVANDINADLQQLSAPPSPPLVRSQARAQRPRHLFLAGRASHTRVLSLAKADRDQQLI